MRNKISIISNLIIVGIFIVLVSVALPFESKSLAVKVNPNVYYSGDTTQNNVCFMVNVYWGTEYLEDI